MTMPRDTTVARCGSPLPSNQQGLTTRVEKSIYALIDKCREVEDCFPCQDDNLGGQIILALELFAETVRREHVKEALALACQGEHR